MWRKGCVSNRENDCKMDAFHWSWSYRFWLFRRRNLFELAWGHTRNLPLLLRGPKTAINCERIQVCLIWQFRCTKISLPGTTVIISFMCYLRPSYQRCWRLQPSGIWWLVGWCLGPACWRLGADCSLQFQMVQQEQAVHPSQRNRVIFFRLLWPCIMNVGWRERNQQDATKLMFIIKLLSQHVSGIIMPIIRRTQAVCTQLASQFHTTTAITTSAEHHMRQCTLLFSWWWA